MSWNYRVARRVEPRDQEGLCTRWYSYGVYEVYYNDKGKAHSIAYNPEQMVMCDAPKELVKMAAMIASDVAKYPVIDFHTLKVVNTGKKATVNDNDPSRKSKTKKS